MSTTNLHTDAGSRFWTETQHGGPTDARPHESTAESVHEDARAAFNEASGRAERESEIRDDDIEPLAHGFGSLKDGLAYAKGMTEYYRANPLEAREKHYRDYAKRPPRPMPEREPPRQPHPDLDARGLREWHLENDIREAMRNAPREQALRREREEAKELLAQAAAELGTTPGKLLEQASAVHQAMETNPAHVSEKVARYFGKPVNEAHAGEIVATAQAAQWENGLMGQIEQAKQSGFAGVERQYAEPMAEFFQHLAATGQHVDYNAAWNAAAQYAEAKVQATQQEAAAMNQELYGEGGMASRYQELQTQEGRQAIAQIVREAPEDPNWKRALHNAVETYRERKHETAEKARRASRSVASSSSGADTRDRDIGGGSIEDDARAAWRAASNSTYV